MPPPTTMKRIAGELGVSITTVSKVLNNRDDIGHATRARVLAKVAELGYQPNAVARSLTLRRTHTLGIVIPDLMHSFFVEIVAGLESVAQRPRVRPAAVQLERGSGKRARRDRHAAPAPGRRHRPRVGQCLRQHRPAAAPRPAGIGLVMIDRDDHPRRPLRSRGDRRRDGRTAGDDPPDRAGPPSDRAHCWAADRPREAARRRATAPR